MLCCTACGGRASRAAGMLQWPQPQQLAASCPLPAWMQQAQQAQRGQRVEQAQRC